MSTHDLNGSETDEHKITLTRCDDPDMLSSVGFSDGARVVLTIDNEGRLIPGEGLSMDEVTQGVFAALSTSLPKYAEIERLRAALKKIANTENSVARSSIREYAASVLQPTK